MSALFRRHRGNLGAFAGAGLRGPGAGALLLARAARFAAGVTAARLRELEDDYHVQILHDRLHLAALDRREAARARVASLAKSGAGVGALAAAARADAALSAGSRKYSKAESAAARDRAFG